MIEPVNRVLADRPAGIARAKQPLRRPVDAPVAAQFSKQRRREQRIAVLRALALLDAQRHAPGVHIAQFEMTDLRQAQAGAVRGHEDRAVLQVDGLLDERCHFLAREDLRQLLRLTRLRNLELRLWTLKRHAVEEPNALRRDVAARPGELALANQVQQVVLNLLLTDALGAAPIVLRQLRHRPDIRFACSLRHSANHEIALHLLAQSAHRRLLVPVRGRSPAPAR